MAIHEAGDGHSTRYLLAIAFLFKLVGSLSISDTMNIILTALSIVSVMMAIIIKWDDFAAKYNKYFNKKKNGRNKK